VHNAAARGWLRSLLGRYLGVAPHSIEFRFNEHGKPSLAGAHERSSLRFNISHSHGFALFAFARGREVGVDIEKIRPGRPFQRIAERFFAPGETARFSSIPAAQQAHAFFECWTRKEAYIKARGKGLSLPLDSFEVGFGPGTAPSLFEALGEPDAPGRWALFDLQPFPEFAGALAAEQPVRHLHCWRIESET
jgi:4'-phosphopantetheinyl transferase